MGKKESLHQQEEQIASNHGVRIETDANGKMKRVYIEHDILIPQPLLNLQQALVQDIVFKPVIASDFHVTLFHYGKPESIYADVTKANPEMAFDIFMARFSTMLHDTNRIKGDPMQTTGDSLDIFGDSFPVLVMKLKVPPQLTDLHGEVLARFQQFLAECNIQDIEEFMMGSNNLKYQLNYNPHVSLGFPHAPVQPPSIDVSNTKITLGSPKFANVTFTNT